MKKALAKILIGASAIVMGVTSATTFALGQQRPCDLQIGGCDNLNGSENLITGIKNFINYTIGFLGFIALVILLWGGFQMVTAAGDDAKYKKGFQILKQAALGLVFIGVSAMLVQLIFYIIGIMGG